MLERSFPWIDDGPSSLKFDFVRLKMREAGNFFSGY